MRPLRLGTRGSRLARVQASFVETRLLESHPELTIETEIIRTIGDTVQDRPLHEIGSDGLFIKAIETALLDGRIDLAVHSMKDLPSIIPEGLMIGAVPRRHDPRDAFVGREIHSLDRLPERAQIATGSLRRKSQLLRWRPELKVVPLRGNVPTRLEKLDASDWDGIILAVAGLSRLGMSHRISAPVPTEIMLPAVGQGGLAIEIRSEDLETTRLVEVLHDDESAVAIQAERALLKGLSGGCQVPVAGHARISGGEIRLEGYVGGENGEENLRLAMTGPRHDADALGARLAEKMLEAGAESIVASHRAP